jgi:hypothetical protein
MEPFDLASAVDRQQWDWLLDACRRLRVALEVVDDENAPLLPPVETHEGAVVRRLLTSPDRSIIAAAADVRQTGAPIALTVADFQILCAGLSTGGLLLLGREMDDDESTAGSRNDLEAIAAWLIGAIEASLVNPPNAITAEPYRIASMRRILNENVSTGSIRKVMGAFVEALGVWDSVRARSYAAADIGGFVHYVSPVGTLRSSVPGAIDDAAVPADRRLLRLPRADADRLGFAVEVGDVLMQRLETGAQSAWLMVFSGAIDQAEQARLAVYSDMLREAIDEVQAIGRGTVATPRIAPNEPLEPSIEVAVAQLAGLLGAHQAALSVTTVTGIRALAVGPTMLLPNGGYQPRIDRLVVTSSDSASVMTLVLAREQPPFMAFEREIAETAAAVLHPSIQAALLPSAESERRRRFRPLDSMFDQLAARAVGAGQDASVIVIAVGPGTVAPGLLQSWIASIRVQLRAGDFAGILNDTEIAVLLCDTSAEQAAVVAARLKELVQTDNAEGTLVEAAVTTTTRSPDMPFEGSLVGAARAGLIVPPQARP